MKNAWLVVLLIICILLGTTTYYYWEKNNKDLLQKDSVIAQLQNSITSLKAMPIELPSNGYTASDYVISYLSDDPLVSQYTKDTLTHINDYPELVDLVKPYWDGFGKYNYITAGTKVARFSDGSKELIVAGCEENNCSGTLFIIAFDLDNNLAYLLKENIPIIQIFGQPNENTKKVLLDIYDNWGKLPSEQNVGYYK